MRTSLYPISSILTVLFFVTKVISEGYPGTYICYYFGDVSSICNGKPVDVCTLPPECTSFAYDGLIIDRLTPNNNGIITPISASDFPYLDAVMTTNKPSYVLLYHEKSNNFRYDKDGIDTLAKQDSSSILNFIGVHPKLNGLIFADIDLTLYQDDFSKFTKNFQVYLHYMRKTTNNFTIGVTISASSVIDILVNHEERTGFVDPDPIISPDETKENKDWVTYNIKHAKSLDFSVFDMEVDFYVFTFSIFNKCTPDLVHGGTIPLDGPYPHTLLKLKQAIDLLNIKNKKKIYFKFQLFAISNRSRKLTYKNECYSTFERICKYPSETCHWCADNSTSLREKVRHFGVFQKKKHS
ncbi:Hypothetical protein CINCED_3A006649 [Cinara cedri]|uniref:Glycoside hydrolase superfamily n=1 Tax=Cinara cedri TaxID=506608 RepID=A0A5E4MDT0_9HEMI|nr:Hypothetical protein CINCED_3A006649 [Cinara cedri]